MRCKMTSFEYLQKKKEPKSKMSKIKYHELNIQQYLISSDINLRRKQLLFKLRTRMMPTPENFGKYRVCRICEIDQDNTSHVMSCLFLKSQVPESLNFDADSIEHIYGNDLCETIKFLKIFEMMWRKREELLESMNTTVSEEHDM